MGDALLAVDTVYGIMFLVAGVLAAMQERRELVIAKWLVIGGAIVFLTRWGVWAMTTNAHWGVRAFAGAIIGAMLFALVPAAFHWLSDRANAAPPQQNKTNEALLRPPSGKGDATVNGTNNGVVTGTINGSVTINHNSHIDHVDNNEGVLVPAHRPTPPLPPGLNAAQIPKDALKVFLGSNVAWATRMPHTVLTMAGEPMITIDRKKGHDELVVTVLRIFDDRNNIIARIDADGFWVENSTRKKRPDSHTLVVFDHTDTEVLRITFLNRTTISVTGIFRHASLARPVIVTPEYADLGGPRLTGNVFGENASDIAVGRAPQSQ